jgi:hypothetical protein
MPPMVTGQETIRDLFHGRGQLLSFEQGLIAI